MVSSRADIYLNAPLQWVAFELRFPQVPAFLTQEGRIGLYDALRANFPILGAQSPALDFPAGALGATFGQVASLRMFNRTRTRSVAVAPDSVVIEAGDYIDHEEFFALVTDVLTHADRIAAIPSMTRVGLRYVDEIRVAGVGRPQDWTPYVSDALLGPIEVAKDFAPNALHGVLEFDLEDGHRAVMRFGALNGYAVDPGGPLRIRNRGDGPYFLIDLDSYWTAPTDEYPEFSVNQIEELCNRLRRPVRDLFEATITEKLRNDVLRKEIPSPS